MFVRLSQLAIQAPVAMPSPTRALEVVDLVRGVLDERRRQHDVWGERTNIGVDPRTGRDRGLAGGEEPKRATGTPGVGATGERVDDRRDHIAADRVALPELDLEADLRGHPSAQRRSLGIARVHVPREVGERAHQRARAPPAVEVGADGSGSERDRRELGREPLRQGDVSSVLLDEGEGEVDGGSLARQQAEGFRVVAQVARVVEEEEDPRRAARHGGRVPAP